MDKLTKKEIKKCKKNIYNHGIIYYGYWDGIFKEIAKIDVDLMLEITETLIKAGHSKKENESSFNLGLINTFCKYIGYQDFKKLVPWLLGFYGIKYENGELIQY